MGLLGFLLTAELYRPVPLPYTVSGQAAAMEGASIEERRGGEGERMRGREKEKERKKGAYAVLCDEASVPSHLGRWAFKS